MIKGLKQAYISNKNGFWLGQNCKPTLNCGQEIFKRNVTPQ